MQSTSSRKGRTSITHLMNFTLPPRPQNTQQPYFGRKTRRNPSWGLGSGYHAADKARYVVLVLFQLATMADRNSGISMPTIVSSLPQGVITVPSPLTQTFIWIGAMFCRFWSLLNRN